MLPNITQRMPETHYSRADKQPVVFNFSHGDQITLLLSEVAVPRTQSATRYDASLTHINVPEWGAVVDTLYARLGQTEVESEVDSAATDEHGETADPSESPNEERLVFLARKYAGQASREDNARLEILTQKVRRLMPRVSTSDIDRLTAIAEEFAEAKQDHQELREKIGLD